MSEGVKISTYAFKFSGYFKFIGPFGRTFEHHVLQKVGDAVDFFRLIFRTGSNQNQNRGRLRAFHGNDNQTKSRI